MKNPRVSRRKEIIKIRPEITEKETKETIAKIGYKINKPKYLAFLYTNHEKNKKRIKETIPFTIVMKRIKYL